MGADETPIEQLVGRAFDLGLYKKIKSGYTKIAHLYEPGDEIFLFGFSRGAYTARSLAGIIATCGLPAQSFDDSLVDTAFDAYRNKDRRSVLLQSLSAFHMDHPHIGMVGVWDTVGSLGIPSIIGGVSPIIYGFLDTGLIADVLDAYHALAIDERRAEFPPTLWTSQPAPGQVIEQVWFCGCHNDVGGGTSAAANDLGTALSDIPLSWMMGKAAVWECKLQLQPWRSTRCQMLRNVRWTRYMNRGIPCGAFRFLGGSQTAVRSRKVWPFVVNKTAATSLETWS